MFIIINRSLFCLNCDFLDPVLSAMGWNWLAMGDVHNSENNLDYIYKPAKLDITMNLPGSVYSYIEYMGIWVYGNYDNYGNSADPMRRRIRPVRRAR